MLRYVPPDSESALFRVSTADDNCRLTATREAMCLPEHLLTKWIASNTTSIDLRGAQLSPAQWCTLTAAILHTPTTAVTSVHLAAGSKLKNDLATAFSQIQFSFATVCEVLHRLHVPVRASNVPPDLTQERLFRTSRVL